MALQSAFNDYIAILSEDKELVGHEDVRLYISRDRTHQIRSLVEGCERTSQFRRLVQETKTAYAERPDREGNDSWQSSVSHVLRRSRIYAAVNGGDHSPNELLKRFVDAFAGLECTAVFMAPLEAVEFSANRPLDFGSFQIRKFSREELSTITENDTRSLFYEESVLDICLLSQYWWLLVPYVPESIYPGQRFKINVLRFPVERRYSSFPTPVERTLQTLVLYDWDTNLDANPSNDRRYGPLEDSRTWLGFSLPFVMRFGGSLFGPPSQAPNVSNLALEPFFNEDGEEIGERPRSPIHYLSAEETRAFCHSVEKFDNQLNTIRTQTKKWRFIDVAVSHLVKAFFAFELDQLLWHTVAIEALLGQREHALTDSLAKRCGSVLGSTKAGREQIGQSFREIYRLRSDVVHGNEKLRKIHDGHLSAGRYIARDVTVWFLDFLCHIAEGMQPDDERLPSRRELLSALDTKSEQRKRISHIFSRVPIDFPSNDCWDDEQ
ncbi:MAG: HEPN domain-containing protein [Gemmatimonadota bacterium]|nr:HEPN domain-containing protein [Gemmatimonadota bacterium]